MTYRNKQYKLNNQRALEILACMRVQNFTPYSDSDLKKYLIEFKSIPLSEYTDQRLAKLFAVINEAISRRLGPWKLFESENTIDPMAKYLSLANQITKEPQYAKKISECLYPSIIDQSTFNTLIEIAIPDVDLTYNEKIVIRNILYVTEKSKFWDLSEILLEANFYTAIGEIDTEQVLKFSVTDEQVLAGLHLLHSDVVEMNAGEGKTIAAAFPASIHAITGRHVDVITSNDYLASRDFRLLSPIYKSLGLTVGAILSPMTDEERRYAYTNYIIYGTLREFGFDYLRNNLRLPPDISLRCQMDVAIIDEIDQVLIDQSNTPLIIAGEPLPHKRAFKRTQRAVSKLLTLQKIIETKIEGQLNDNARTLSARNILIGTLFLANPYNKNLLLWMQDESSDFRVISSITDDLFRDYECDQLYYIVDIDTQSIVLTERGRDILEEELGPLFDISDLQRMIDSLPTAKHLPLKVRRSNEIQLRRQLSRRYNRISQVYQSLRANTLIRKDVDYIVDDGQIQLIDQHTGRVLTENRYQQGLHIALEDKEGLTVLHENETMAEISVWGFIQLYSNISGLTGTAMEIKGELFHYYGLYTVKIHPSHPIIRSDYNSKLYQNSNDKTSAILDEVTYSRSIGRPVLINTLTIAESLELSELFSKNNLEHNVLNAVTNQSEENIIKEAGTFGAITIATNMAGRGTDILLDRDLNELIIHSFLEHIDRQIRDTNNSIAISCNSIVERDLVINTIDNDPMTVLTHRISTGSSSNEIVVGSRSTVNKSPSIHTEFGLGLYVIITSINKNCRTARQVIGRSGRQGAFGSTRSILSEDDPALCFSSKGLTFQKSEQKSDDSGRQFFEGLKTDRSLKEIQESTESENSVFRTNLYEYQRVMEEMTSSYYGSRQKLISNSIFSVECRKFIDEFSALLVKYHFPNPSGWDYNQQFNELAQELELDFDIQTTQLIGTSLVELPEQISRLLNTKLDSLQLTLGNIDFSETGIRILLTVADDLWRDQIVERRELMTTLQLMGHGLKTSVSEFIFHCLGMNKVFREGIIRAFLPKLLTYKLPTSSENRITSTHIDDELEKILV